MGVGLILGVGFIGWCCRGTLPPGGGIYKVFIFRIELIVIANYSFQRTYRQIMGITYLTPSPSKLLIALAAGEFNARFG
jgi:hypothetical protein